MDSLAGGFFSGAGWLASGFFSGAGWLASGFFSGAGWLASGFFSGAGGLASGFFSGAGGLASGFFSRVGGSDGLALGLCADTGSVLTAGSMPWLATSSSSSEERTSIFVLSRFGFALVLVAAGFLGLGSFGGGVSAFLGLVFSNKTLGTGSAESFVRFGSGVAVLGVGTLLASELGLALVDGVVGTNCFGLGSRPLLPLLTDSWQRKLMFYN